MAEMVDRHGEDGGWILLEMLGGHGQRWQVDIGRDRGWTLAKIEDVHH